MCPTIRAIEAMPFARVLHQHIQLEAKWSRFCVVGAGQLTVSDMINEEDQRLAETTHV
jgi:hypothetical protein